jgi:hypothetical protein
MDDRGVGFGSGEARGKRPEGRGQREEERGKRKEGRGKREEERGKRKEGRGKREEARGRKRETSRSRRLVGLPAGFSPLPFSLCPLSSVLFSFPSVFVCPLPFFLYPFLFSFRVCMSSNRP